MCFACRRFLRSELFFRDTSGHDACGGEAATDHIAHLVHDLRTTPLLMGQGLNLVLALLALDHGNIGVGTLCGILLGEEVDAEGIAVEASQGDELPAEAQLRQVPNEGLHLRIRHACTVPVEGGAQVVGQHLMGHRGTHFLGKLRGLCQDGLTCLHPNAVRIGGEGNGTFDAELRGTLDAIVALDGACGIPVEENIQTHVRGSFPHLVNGHLARVLQPLGGVLALGLQLLGHSLREGHAACALFPVLVGALAHGLEEWLRSLDGDTLDVRMVNGIDVGVDHGGRLRISARHQDQGRVQHIGLKSDGNEALDVLLGRDQDLATHVSALLGARLLILDVNSRSAVLNEHLRQLHGGSDATMSSVSIRNDGVQIVHGSRLGAVLRRHTAALLVLLAVVEELRAEELIHLVGHGVVGVVRHIGSRLVGGGGGGGALPAADVD
mmetsp:Transcript_33377/g.71895  ORF Transcript_33377/g.71895 Transcript_33377/m.71895 type:complete len:438 (-) Transcript_33377:409-1722(-)